ncbi:YbaB/EbfC family nucleoid-associated protein [Nonomuraea sp. NPDC050394]|uniref:YbaB/EbfC family nucleoid-associated protein n=1 Tax=Nonomuraea sp. NPDC050394 TaxID=3364363 RepID=UPI0037AB419B
MTHGNAFQEGRDGDLAGLIRDFEGWVDAFAGALRELAEERLTGVDDTGLVAATVSGTGRLLRVTIDPRAMRDLGHSDLGPAVLQAILAARAAMGEGLEKAMTALSGGRPPAGQDVLQPYFDAVLRQE